MTVNELSREQLTELKGHYLMFDKSGEQDVSWDEFINADNLVSDEDVKKYYENFSFTDDDFACSANAYKIDIMYLDNEKTLPFREVDNYKFSSAFFGPQSLYDKWKAEGNIPRVDDKYYGYVPDDIFYHSWNSNLESYVNEFFD